MFFSMLSHYTMQTSHSHISCVLRHAALKPTARVGFGRQTGERGGNKQKRRSAAAPAHPSHHPSPKSPISLCKQKALQLRLTAFSPAKLLLDHGLPPLLLQPTLNITFFILGFGCRYGPDRHT